MLATAGNVGSPPFAMIVAGRPDRPIAVGNDPAKARCSQDFSAAAVKVVTRQGGALSSGMSKAA
jgi:predicted RNA methylase